MTLVDGLTIFALIAGPVSAVLITRYFDRKREVNKRKWEVFRNLMCYRRQITSQGFVSSLNLLEVEFHDDKDVLTAWKSLYNHLNTEEPTDSNRKKTFFDDRGKLRATLLQKVAQSLGIKLNNLDMLQSGYYPQRWEWDEDARFTILQKLKTIFENSEPLPVSISNFPDNENNATSEKPEE